MVDKSGHQGTKPRWQHHRMRQYRHTHISGTFQEAWHNPQWRPNYYTHNSRERPHSNSAVSLSSLLYFCHIWQWVSIIVGQRSWPMFSNLCKVTLFSTGDWDSKIIFHIKCHHFHGLLWHRLTVSGLQSAIVTEVV